MKPQVALSLVALSAAAFCGAPALLRAAPAKPAKPSASPTNAPAVAAEIEIPHSVFVIPASPREGRNPFFPRSSNVPEAPKVRPQDAREASAIKLNGIVPNGPQRSAMINGRTFERGEEAEIRLPSGVKVLIKCEEIKEDSVEVLVNGTMRRQLRLRSGL